MVEITVNGEFDHLYFDDRIAALEKFKGTKRILQYGSNSLNPPVRALTEKETRIAESLGLPPQNQKVEQK
jgi:hypothetical protein